MNLVDLAIIAVVGFGVFIGWRNGLIGPVLAEGAFLIGYWVVSRNPGLAALVPSAVPRPLAILLLPAAVGLCIGIAGRLLLGGFLRLRLIRQVDKAMGAVGNGALSFVIVYVVLLGLVGAGTVLNPLVQAKTIQPEQIAAIRLLLAKNPGASTMVPAGELSHLAAATSARPLPLDQLGQYAKVIEYYQHNVRPQLANSELAPIVLELGARLPVIGRPATIPKSG